MSPINRLFSHFLTRNILMFLAFLGYNLMVAFSYTKTISRTGLIVIICFDVLLYGWFILHNRILAERFLFTKRYSPYLLGLALALMVHLVLGFKASSIDGVPFSWASRVIGFAFYTAMAFFIYTTFKYFRERDAMFRIALLEREIELQKLKWQMNPHFLFNALNNIYSYQLEENKYANDLILSLGQLMRYMIESQNKENASLAEELQFIDNYVAFEKERLGYRCHIQYEKKVANPELTLPPLLLFPFVENAFKHGTNTVQETTIAISICQERRALILSVRNQVFPSSSISTKTGLANATKRLELLFPGRHELNISHVGTAYAVELKLDLT